ncbi:MAG: hypothetical protein FWG39_02850 [Alphaproteobacteria bacterium]|nr:hypothetical protein [Alphaproteobacteria bacterium]
MQIISLDRALELGFDTVHVFRFAGFGDALMFAAGVREKVRRTGAPILIATKPKNYDMMNGIDDGLPAGIFILENYYAQVVNKTNVRRMARRGLSVNLFGQSEKHWIVAEIAVGLGLSGRANLTPYMHVDKKLDGFGKLTKRPQIAIMTGGHVKKNIPQHVYQAIVNKYKDKYDFVLLGLPDDPILDGVIDMRGKLRFADEVPAVLRESDLFIGIEGGLMHIAAAMRTRAVIGDAWRGKLSGDAGHIHISPKGLKKYRGRTMGDTETFDMKEIFKAIDTQLALAGTPVPDTIVDLTGIPVVRPPVRRDSLVVNLLDLLWRHIFALLRVPGHGIPHDRIEQLKYKLKYGMPI